MTPKQTKAFKELWTKFAPTVTVREFRERYATANRTFGKFRKDYQPVVDAWAVYTANNERLRLALSFRTDVGYTYCDRAQTGSNNGGYHIVVAEDVTRGRLVRRAGDALCKPAAKFWGLASGRAGKDLPDCLACAEIAERLGGGR